MTPHLAAPQQLTLQQVLFFKTFGYLKLPGLFADDIGKITEEYMHTMQDNAADLVEWKSRAHDDKPRHAMAQFIDRSIYLSAMIDDPRITGVFSSLLGDDFSYRGSDANIFNCGTCWHSDNYGAIFKYLNVKLIFYLEPLDAESGCLRVMPGSQHWGDRFANTLAKYLRQTDSFVPDLGLQDEDIPGQLLPTQPGDVIAFDFRVSHAACFKGNQRRAFTICATQHMADEDLPRLRELMLPAKALGCQHYYGKAMIETASPARMVHLRQCHDNDYCLRE